MDSKIEKMAESVHNAYLETCAKLGWPVKPSNAVPYAELSEDSKELDRASLRAVLKYISDENCDCEEAPQTKNLSFGQALQFLKAGKKVARAGWNGKGMWLAYSPGSKKLPANKFWAGPNRDYANTMSEQCADVLPCITMKTVTGEILMGWLASQTDMLANDWQVVE